jgi:hypothetical protein
MFFNHHTTIGYRVRAGRRCTVQIGTFLFGTVIASGTTIAAAVLSGASVFTALGLGVLTAFIAQLLYLVLITSLAAREADNRRTGGASQVKRAKADQKPVGTAQP